MLLDRVCDHAARAWHTKAIWAAGNAAPTPHKSYLSSIGSLAPQGLLQEQEERRLRPPNPTHRIAAPAWRRKTFRAVGNAALPGDASGPRRSTPFTNLYNCRAATQKKSPATQEQAAPVRTPCATLLCVTMLYLLCVTVLRVCVCVRENVMCLGSSLYLTRLYVTVVFVW